MRNLTFVLGALDPEMLFIRSMLMEHRVTWVYATHKGRRCARHNAYAADGYSRSVDSDAQRVWVECRSDDYNADRDLIVDHHFEGDPGYEAAPHDFWAGSSIGQACELVGGSYEKYKYAAASDHCLAAAMRGECAGICPTELMNWRTKVRASMGRFPASVLSERLTRALREISELPRLRIAGVEVIDATFRRIPEVRDAAAIAKMPILLTKLTATKQVRIGLYGAPQEVTEDWLKAMSSADGVTHGYGNPHREYASIVLSDWLTNSMRQANGV